MAAGGSVSDIRSPYKGGDDGWYLYKVGPMAKTGVTGAQTLYKFLLPFSCTCQYAEFFDTTFTDTDDDSTFTVQDDTGTPKKWINAADAGATGSNVLRVLAQTAADKAVEFFAGSTVSVIWTPGDTGDALTECVLSLWLKPTR